MLDSRFFLVLEKALPPLPFRPQVIFTPDAVGCNLTDVFNQSIGRLSVDRPPFEIPPRWSMGRVFCLQITGCRCQSGQIGFLRPEFEVLGFFYNPNDLFCFGFFYNS